MNERNFKLVQWLLYGLMGISAVLTIIFYINPANPDIILYWGYILFFLSLGILLSISLINIIKNPKGSLKVMIIVAAMVIIGIIAYVLSKNTLNPIQMEKYGVSAGTVRMVGASLIMLYVIMAISIGVLIYTSLNKFFK
jgi:hypothetical protein